MRPPRAEHKQCLTFSVYLLCYTVGMEKTRYRVGLVVGRFQPFHKGHVYLLQQAAQVAGKLVIALGSVGVDDQDNPLSYEQRLAMLHQVLEQEGLADRVIKIFPSHDHESDEAWVREIVEQAGEFEVVIGNNDWTNRVLSEAGYQVMTIPDLRRDVYEGTQVRQLARQGEAWEDRVPEYLVDQVASELK